MSPLECVPFVLSRCHLSERLSEADVVELLPTEDEDAPPRGRGVYRVGDVVIRIFEPAYSPGGKRYADAAFIHESLSKLAGKGPFEECLHSGSLPPTSFEYTVTRSVQGLHPTDEDLRYNTVLRRQIANAIKVLQSVEAPAGFMTVEEFMQPEMEKVKKLLADRPDLESRVGPLCENFEGYKMVLSHTDLGPRNMIIRDDELVAIIDWEFVAFEPEFEEATSFLIPPGIDCWGENFSRDHDLGWERYSEQLVWTCHIVHCRVNSVDADAFYAGVIANLETRGL